MPESTSEPVSALHGCSEKHAIYGSTIACVAVHPAHPPVPLPPNFISTGALDLFLEENFEYARRLIRDGVSCELHVYPGAFHAFNIAPVAGVAASSRRDSAEALARALARSATSPIDGMTPASWRRLPNA